MLSKYMMLKSYIKMDLKFILLFYYIGTISYANIMYAKYKENFLITSPSRFFAPDLRPSKCHITMGQSYPLMERKKKTFIKTKYA